MTTPKQTFTCNPAQAKAELDELRELQAIIQRSKERHAMVNEWIRKRQMGIDCEPPQF